MVVYAHLPLTKGKAISVHSRLLTSSSRNIVEASGAQVLPGLVLEFNGVCGHGWQLVLQKATSVYFLRIIYISTFSSCVNFPTIQAPK